MKWKQYIKEVEGKVQETIDIIFTYEGKLDDLRDISYTCGCTNGILDYPFLKVKLTLPKKHPELIESTFYTDKNIYITYQDNTQETLTIKCTIHE